MADFTIVNAGEKLQVGQVPTDFIGFGSKLLPGTSVLNGPVYIGAAIAPGVASASCMIGPPLGAALPFSLDVKGISNIVGVLNVAGVINRTAVTNAFGATFKNGVSLKLAFSGSFGASIKSAFQITHGPKFASAFFTTPLTKTSVITGANISACYGLPAGCKSFDIVHPSKPDTHRLRYVCLEGPEIGVYIRGKLENSNIIRLPNYWKDLVKIESITVNLTPIGNYQELYVEKIEWGINIKIKNNAGSPPNCYYTVFAERKTKDELQPEYEGLTPEDYPGDNTQYALNGTIRL